MLISVEGRDISAEATLEKYGKSSSVVTLFFAKKYLNKTG
jgi:hypothetical protein